MPAWLLGLIVGEIAINIIWFVFISHCSYEEGNCENFIISPRILADEFGINLFGGICAFTLYFLFFPIYIVVVWTFILLYRLLYWLFHIGVDKK